MQIATLLTFSKYTKVWHIGFEDPIKDGYDGFEKLFLE